MDIREWYYDSLIIFVPRFIRKSRIIFKQIHIKPKDALKLFTIPSERLILHG